MVTALGVTVIVRVWFVGRVAVHGLTGEHARHGGLLSREGLLVVGDGVEFVRVVASHYDTAFFAIACKTIRPGILMAKPSELVFPRAAKKQTLQPSSSSRISGMKPFIDIVRVGAAGPVLRPVGEFYDELAVFDAAQFDDALRSDDPRAVNP